MAKKPLSTPVLSATLSSAALASVLVSYRGVRTNPQKRLRFAKRSPFVAAAALAALIGMKEVLVRQENPELVLAAHEVDLGGAAIGTAISLVTSVVAVKVLTGHSTVSTQRALAYIGLVSLPQLGWSSYRQYKKNRAARAALQSDATVEFFSVR